MILVNNREHRRQPTGRVLIDWENPLARGLVTAWYPQCGLMPLGEIVSMGSMNNVNGVLPTPCGVGMQWSAVNGAGLSLGNVQPYSVNEGFAMLAIASPVASATQSHFWISQRVGTGNIEQLALGANTSNTGGASSGRLTLYARNTAAANQSVTSLSQVDGRMHTWIASNSRSGNGYILRDGIDQAVGTSTTLTGTYISAGQNYRIGNAADFTGTTAAAIAPTCLVLGWDRYVTKQEAFEISWNPWQLFIPVQRRIYIDTAVAAAAFNPGWARGANSVVGVGIHVS